VAQDQQDRVAEAAEDGTLSQLKETLDYEEANPPTGGLNVETFPAPEPQVTPLNCLVDAIGKILDSRCVPLVRRRRFSELIDRTRKYDADREKTMDAMADTIEMMQSRKLTSGRRRAT
jgi:hypothetical protein